MMHCDKCNIDFPEGLRFCKWCGQTLTARRDTGELRTCPQCFAAIQSSWAFCKACGARLAGTLHEALNAACPRCGAVTEPGSLHCLKCGEDLTQGADSSQTAHKDATAILTYCPTCGEQVESGSMYCKGCGSALYSQPAPLGPSALLCGFCNSYSPLGSTICRVCGALLTPAQQSSSGEIAGQKRSSTLPDLPEHLSQDEMERKPAVEPQAGRNESAQTLIMDAPEYAQVVDPSKSGELAEDDKPTAMVRPNRGADTTLLPGVAGSKSEQSVSTSSMQTRITTQVEPDEQTQTEEPQETEPPRDSRDLPAAPATRIDTASSFYFGEQASDNSEAMPEQSQSESSRIESAGTVIFASDMAAPVAFDSGTASGQLEDTAAPREEKTCDKAPPSQDAAREIQPAQAGSQSEAAKTRSEEYATREMRPADMKARPQTWSPAQSDQRVAQPVAPAVPQVERKKSGAKIASAIVVVLILAATGFVVWWYVLGGKAKPGSQDQTQQAADTKQAQPTTQTPAKPGAPVPPEGMVVVAAGRYVIGSDDGSDLERPQHTVELPQFFIDRTEVTNAQYKKFIDATGDTKRIPSNWKNGTYPEGRDNYPVTGVKWDDANAYAEWAGKRLPTEAEWEAAARGSEARKYTWGNDWREDAANIGKPPGNYNAKQYPAEIMPVGSFPAGASPAGALDMIGNVWEWTADEFKLYDDNPLSIEEVKEKLGLVIKPNVTYRVMRGGAFDGGQQHNASYRGFIDGDSPYPKVGFRCVKDAK
ncbi:MAG TPA: SUMF1/EgtB/PvdO family nonheme iron enzyme [Blastocatellia bacterium]|nr:SUMF1/EgtB/PvdO family nonheme iron enzyme [Blastocatellia bacterium]